MVAAAAAGGWQGWEDRGVDQGASLGGAAWADDSDPAGAGAAGSGAGWSLGREEWEDSLDQIIGRVEVSAVIITNDSFVPQNHFPLVVLIHVPAPPVRPRLHMRRTVTPSGSSRAQGCLVIELAPNLTGCSCNCTYKDALRCGWHALSGHVQRMALHLTDMRFTDPIRCSQRLGWFV